MKNEFLNQPVIVINGNEASSEIALQHDCEDLCKLSMYLGSKGVVAGKENGSNLPFGVWFFNSSDKKYYRLSDMVNAILLKFKSYDQKLNDIVNLFNESNQGFTIDIGTE